MKLENTIRYYCCTEVKDQFIYQAFHTGFSDYIIKMDIAEDVFLARFFGPEGNKRENSFIAFDQDEPVGVILGGIKIYEGIQTMRCGTLAIHPAYRGRGISQKLFELHKQEAMKHGCKQLFLEVIVGNDRAVRFYEKLGYEKIYDLVYYTLEDLSLLEKPDSEIFINRIDFEEFKQAVGNWDYHINWQNDLDYIEQTRNISYYHARREDGLAGCLAISAAGTIHFLMVDRKERGKGVGTQLLQTAGHELHLSKMSAGFPNNSLLEGFFKKQGFKKGVLKQFEMYLLL
ncbi:GNAT family N-acetyltransferase [Neobacillus sp. OS1-2]|uniref:GNAT family N-acetyltransferase n=1 Tax=Neobacillus sp. OS1-2 TaxID=3070680 RepID=UPI0027E0BD9B|nr:GNAT family N-acetyltransferase [Neobacillus sp. OS1-2]WML39709.1 GNAT family N-acetyltransferase [Neobacillus sp. OS1-2]